MIKKVVYVVCACLAIVYLSLILVGDLVEDRAGDKEPEGSILLEENQDGDQEKSIIKVPDYPITKGLAAKAIALTFYEYSDLLTMDIYSDYSDCTKEDWYYYYVNAVIANDWMSGKGENFNPYGLLTEQETYELFKHLGMQYNPIELEQYELDGDTAISYDEFFDLYLELIKANLEDVKVAEHRLFVFSTQQTDESLGRWQVATNKGLYDYGGLSLDNFMDQEVAFIVNGTKILFVRGVVDETPEVSNVYIEAINEGEVQLYLGGSSRNLKLESITMGQPGNIIDVVFDEGTVYQIQIKDEEDTGLIKKVDNDNIELVHTTYAFTDDAKVYSSINGELRWLGKSDLLVGSDTSTFILEDGKVCAAIMKEKPVLQNIRIAINNTGFNGLVHGEVKLTCDGLFIFKKGDTEKEYAAEEILIIGGDGVDIENERVYIYPQNSENRIKIITIDRGYGSYYRQPIYRGAIEVAKQDEGYAIINELPIEEYLYAVVPSEMPSSYGVEASKVQAITARSYAYNQMYGNRYHRYGAHVDDSVNCQVYNNIPENDTSITAVNETIGLGLKSGDSIVSANFFSTSCGYTANSGEVWANSTTGLFPQTTPAYLSARPQYETDFNGDLSNEEVFYRFISTDQVNAYDESFTWYRWHVTMTKEEVEASINYNLRELYESRPYLVRTLDEKSIFRTEYVDGVGELIDVDVYKRGEGGNIMEMIIEGSERTVKVTSEYYIRKLICPVQYIEGNDPILLNLQNDIVKEDYSVMPSAFYSLEKVKDEEGNLLQFNFIGGGYGHGVGMSQNGVKGMVDLGYDYQSILEHFYQGIKIEPIY